MASTPEGRRLTNAMRREQVRIKAEFMKEFLDIWPLLNPYDLDTTGGPWIQAAMPIIQRYRDLSADQVEEYYRRFREIEAPEKAAEKPPPRITRGYRSNLVRPTIDWTDFDKATEISLAVTGPSNIKAKRKRGKSPEQAKRDALVQAGGSAARHVLSGGREAHLELVKRDPIAVGHIRVTRSGCCAWCAMLASRGPVYKNANSASRVVRGRNRPVGAEYHDNCMCTSEAVYSNSQAWPGDARKFQQMWIDFAKGKKDSVNAFRRAYEREQREAARKAV